MKKFRTVAALACVISMTSFPVSADSCATLDYVELQDMSVTELVKEMCLASKTASDKIYESLNNFVRSGVGEKNDEAASSMLNSGIDQCRNQPERMRKILVRKGVEESYSTYKILCSPK